MNAQALFKMLLMFALAACVAPAWAQRQPPATQRSTTPPPRLVSAGQAIPLIRNEAIEVLKAEQSRGDEDRPAVACDFAARKNLAAPNDDVVRVSLRPLNPDNAAMDAYIRWQLLSFNPRYEGLIDPADLKRILIQLPAFVPQPQYKPPPSAPATPPASLSIVTQKTIVVGQRPVPGTTGSRPKLAVVTSGVVMSSGGSDPPPAPEASDIQADIRQAREKMASTNRWVATFRDALIPRLPEGRGVRITAMLQDLCDRLSAGDPSWEDALARVMSACEALPPAGTKLGALSMDQRRALAEQTRQIGQISTPYIERVVRKPGGEIGLEGYYIAVPPEDLQRLLALLAGEPAPATRPASP